MPLDDAFEAGSMAMLQDMAQRPQAPRPQAPSFSLWGLTKSAPRGLTAGAAQGAGSVADVTGAFGDVLGSLDDAGSQGMFGGLTEDERRQKNAARDKLLKEGPSFTSEGGTVLRGVARDYMPDPATAHGSEQAVANLFRLGGKAVVASTVLGPWLGAGVAGAEEGFSTADDLKQQGVDLATRTKVGAVTAAFTAGSLALPVAGPTIKSTVGLAVAGGPLSFIGQQAATREILQAADYSQLANQYDPFDPVGLTLSTLLPLGFGALAMRGARVKGGAKPVEEGAPAARVEPEVVDAARVNLLREKVDEARLAPREDIAAGAAHDNAMARALDQVAAGERVNVSDLASPATIARVGDALAPRLAAVADEVGPALRELDTPAPARPVAEVLFVKPDEPSSASKAAGEPEGKLVGESPEVERAANLLEAERPDLMVHLDGQEAPVPLGELMKRIREELGNDLKEAPLIEAAAACFVS